MKTQASFLGINKLKVVILILILQFPFIIFASDSPDCAVSIKRIVKAPDESYSDFVISFIKAEKMDELFLQSLLNQEVPLNFIHSLKLQFSGQTYAEVAHQARLLDEFLKDQDVMAQIKSHWNNVVSRVNAQLALMGQKEVLLKSTIKNTEDIWNSEPLNTRSKFIDTNNKYTVYVSPAGEVYFWSQKRNSIGGHWTNYNDIVVYKRGSSQSPWVFPAREQVAQISLFSEGPAEYIGFLYSNEQTVDIFNMTSPHKIILEKRFNLTERVTDLRKPTLPKMNSAVEYFFWIKKNAAGLWQIIRFFLDEKINNEYSVQTISEEGARQHKNTIISYSKDNLGIVDYKSGFFIITSRSQNENKVPLATFSMEFYDKYFYSLDKDSFLIKDMTNYDEVERVSLKSAIDQNIIMSDLVFKLYSQRHRISVFENNNKIYFYDHTRQKWQVFDLSDLKQKIEVKDFWTYQGQVMFTALSGPGERGVQKAIIMNLSLGERYDLKVNSTFSEYAFSFEDENKSPLLLFIESSGYHFKFYSLKSKVSQ